MSKFKGFVANALSDIVLALMLGAIGFGLVVVGASLWHPLVIVGAIFILIALFIGTNPG